MKTFALYRPDGSWVTNIKAATVDDAHDKALDYARVLPNVGLDLHDERGEHVGFILFRKGEPKR